MKKALVIHPFLFALYPPLFLFSRNIDKIPLPHFFITTATIVFSTFLLWVSCGFIFKNKIKAGLTISLFLLWCFFYTGFFEMGKGLVIGHWVVWRHKYIFTIWSMALAFAGVFFIIKRGHFNNLTNILNVVSVSLVVLCVSDIGIYKFKGEKQALSIARKVEEAEYIKADTANSDKSVMLPDIYYIILDAYANYGTLKKFYNLDNAKFYNYLYKKGFYVAHASRSNYGCTRFSLASSLNMEYINDSFDEYGLENVMVYAQITKNNKVMHFLKMKGYKFITIGFNNEYADLSLFYRKGEEFSEYLFSKYLLEMTFLKYFAHLADVGFDQGHRNSILYAFDTLSKVTTTKGPKFIFAHILSPHPPFTFGPYGGKNTLFQSIRMGLRKLYTRQLIFINKKVEEMIDVILAQSEIPPIIILQADHGYNIGTPGDSFFDHQTVEEKLTIFNAYYLPDNGKDILYESITPVNTFRILLNHYFNANYELLKDESYLYFNKRFINVTDKINMIRKEG